ncbi:MAG: ribokinase [Anaerolinea sp.]|nr:ribokinase [Anaerolinea sp.]
MTDLRSFLDRFSGITIMVVGDVVLDEYLVGTAARLSREAPVPVLEFVRRDLIPGGGCNPAANIASLGAKALQIGVVGADSNAETLRSLLQGRGIDPVGLVVDPERHTTTKTRVLAQTGLRFPQQVARIDRVDRHPLTGAGEAAVLDRIRALAPHVQAVAVSDYLAGVVTGPIAQTVRDACDERGILATADAQGELEKFSGYDLVKCNADEVSRHLGRTLHTDGDFAAAGSELAKTLRLRGAMLITRGAEGISVCAQDGHGMHIVAPKVQDVFDTVGAGDTVLAVVTLALSVGASYAQAAALANCAAGIVIRRVGNYAPSLDELRAAVQEAIHDATNP